MSKIKKPNYIEPGKSMRRVVGPYNTVTCKPKYSIDIDCPSHVRNQIKENTFLTGTPEKCSWAWEVVNNSTWPIFVVVKKDGIIISNNNENTQ